MDAVWMRFRSEMRSRWRAWLGLALLFGVAAGAAITAAAGARRTDSAYPRFVRAQDAFHASTGGGAEDAYEERYAALKKHPAVADATEIVIVGAELTIPGARQTVLKLPDIVVATDPSGRALYETNRAKVVEGRLADRARPDEAMIPFTLADRYGIEVGDRVVAGVGFDFEAFPAPLRRVPVRVAGIVAAPGDFEAVGQQAFSNIYVTPAFLQTHRALIPPLNPDTWNLAVHLHGGPQAAAAFKQTVERDFNLDVPVIEPVVRSGVQKTIRLYVAALWLLAVLIASGTLAILGQTLARQQLLDSADYPALSAIGLSRRHLLGLGMLRAALIGAVAAVVAVAVSFVLSPLTPIGHARVAEPDPGFAFDPLAIGIGAVAVLVLIPALALIPAWRAARLSAAGDRASLLGPARPSRIVEGVSRVSRSAAAVAGLRMALEPGRGRTAVPVRSTVLAVALGVAAVTGSVLVGRSLTHLIDTPALAGFTYDAILPDNEENPTSAKQTERKRQLHDLPFVEAAATGTAINSVFAGVDSFILGFEEGEPIGYAVIEGRAPTDDLSNGLPEIAVGPTTMRRLHLRIGDAVTFGYPAHDEPTTPDEEPQERREFQRARVVGVAAVPSVPWAITEPGEGGVMTIGAFRASGIDPGGGCCFVRFKDGTDLTAARKQLEDAGFEVSLRTERADLATLERISRLPAVLSVIFGVIAAGALIHVLSTGIRRRRRELAILKTLGFVRSQVRSAVAWQSSTIALLALAAGIPAGIVLGRWGWRLVAAQFGVVPVAIAPALFLALLVPAAIVLANLVAAIPGRVAARTRPALVLRTE